MFMEMLPKAKAALAHLGPGDDRRRANEGEGSEQRGRAFINGSTSSSACNLSCPCLPSFFLLPLRVGGARQTDGVIYNFAR